MNAVNHNPYGIGMIGRQQTSGEIDYVKDGTLYRGANAPVVQVNAESELSELSTIYSVGTIAYTAGWKNAWQLDSSGSWVSMT